MARLGARGLATGRVAIGAVLVAAPTATARRWLGARTDDDPAREIALRGLGARDVLLGVGALVALRSGSDARAAARWIEAGIVADLADAAAMAVSDDVDTTRLLVLTGALSAGAFGAVIRGGLR